MPIMLVGITRYLSYYLTFHVICFDRQRTRILSYMIVACHIWHATKIWQFFIVRFNIQTLNMASHFDFSVTFYMRYYLPRTWIIVCLVHESLSASYLNHCLPRTWIIVCLVHESLSASYMNHCLPRTWIIVCLVIKRARDDTRRRKTKNSAGSAWENAHSKWRVSVLYYCYCCSNDTA
jgi:hypothetical protein